MATKTARKRKSTSAGPRRTGTLSPTQATAPEAVTEQTPVPAPQTSPVAPSALNTEMSSDADTDAAASAPAEDERLKRSDLIESVAKRVSLKRSEAKMVFDVVLDEIGKALDSSDEVVLPPLGKLMVKKRMEKPGGNMLTVKLKRADVDPAAGDVAPLADPDEDS